MSTLTKPKSPLFVDLEGGPPIGRLIEFRYAGRDHRGSLWECLCECGNRVTVTLKALRRGWSKSCGCLSRDLLMKRNTVHRHAPRGSFSPEYITWQGIINRCYCPKSGSYGVYGGRGIRVCERWRQPGGRGFLNFLADMGPKPSEDIILKRVDTAGDYEPGNCSWKPSRPRKKYRRRAGRPADERFASLSDVQFP